MSKAKERLLDPKQEAFLHYYTDRRSNSFCNAYQSAIKAGYSESYALNIKHLLPDWLSESIGDTTRLRKAEQLMDKIIALEAMTEDGKVDNSLIANQIKVISLIAKGIGKGKYSERTELTGKEGGPIETKDLSELSDEELDRLIALSSSRESKEGEGEETS